MGAGLRIGHLGPRPDEPLELYEFEGCPFSRRVRETLSILDLEVQIYPCPRGGTRFRPELEALGASGTPFLIDPNTGAQMGDSEAIVEYLYRRYGDGEPPANTRGPLFLVTSALASIYRAGRGSKARPGRLPDKPLELYGMEGCPFCRLVREELSELELPYLLHNVAKGSPSRQALVARANGGKIAVPYLVDPNTGEDVLESTVIVEYLRRNYA